MEFNIYVLALSPKHKKESSSLEKCPEKVDISLNEGNVDDPGPKIKEDVKKQIKQIFPSASNIVEKENVVNASITLEDLKEINPNLYVDVCPEPIPTSDTSSGGLGSTGKVRPNLNLALNSLSMFRRSHFLRRAGDFNPGNNRVHIGI